MKQTFTKFSWRGLSPSRGPFSHKEVVSRPNLVGSRFLNFLYLGSDSWTTDALENGWKSEEDWIQSRLCFRSGLRIRMEVNISNPLIPGIFLPQPNKRDLWIGLKYEKILDLYYRCGIIGHDQKGCPNGVFSLCNPAGKSFNAVGPWLRSKCDEIPNGVLKDLPSARPATKRENLSSSSAQFSAGNNQRQDT